MNQESIKANTQAVALSLNHRKKKPAVVEEQPVVIGKIDND